MQRVGPEGLGYRMTLCRYMVFCRVILRLFWGCIGIMENKMETTISSDYPKPLTLNRVPYA